MIRIATEEDVHEIKEIALLSLSQEDWPVTKDIEGIEETILDGIQDNFCWVSELNGGIVGAVLGNKYKGVWFKEDQATLMLFYCEQSNDGYKMLRLYSDYIKQDNNIKIATVSIESFHDKRYERMFKRLGFNTEGKDLLYIRS